MTVIGGLFKIVVGAVGVAAGAFVGVYYMWVRGIEEVVHGAQATPVNGGDIAWGLVRALVFGDLIIGLGVLVAFLLGAWGVASMVTE